MFGIRISTGARPSASSSGRVSDHSRFDVIVESSSKSTTVNSSSAAGASSMDVVGARALHQQTSGDHKICLEPEISSTSGGRLDELVRVASELGPLRAKV